MVAKSSMVVMKMLTLRTFLLLLPDASRTASRFFRACLCGDHWLLVRVGIEGEGESRHTVLSLTVPSMATEVFGSSPMLPEQKTRPLYLMACEN